jgi:hypothetical protein
MKNTGEKVLMKSVKKQSFNDGRIILHHNINQTFFLKG